LIQPTYALKIISLVKYNKNADRGRRTSSLERHDSHGFTSPLHGGHDNPQRIAPVLVYAPTKRARVRRRHMPRASAAAACTRHTFHRERGYGTLFLS